MNWAGIERVRGEKKERENLVEGATGADIGRVGTVAGQIEVVG